MIKILFTGFHIFILAWLSWMGGESPKVQQLLPTKLEVNQSTIVKVSIQKSKITGFAKLEIDIPSGYAVSALDTKGASFTFSKGKIRFVWMNLPANEKYDISYRLTKTEDVAGLDGVKGVFSFIENNKRADVNVITKVDGQLTAVLDENGYGLTTLNANQDNPSCERKVTKSGDAFSVELMIHLNGLKGFLKLQEWASDGCVITKGQNSGATVTVDGSKIKFVWFEVPETEVVVIKYKVSCPQMPESGLMIDGKLSFVFDNSPREVPVVMMENANTTDVVADNQTKKVDQKPVVEENKEMVQVPVKEDKVVEVAINKKGEERKEEEERRVAVKGIEERKEEVKKVEERVEENKVAMRDSKRNEGTVKSGVQYRVQIMANHRIVSPTEWKAKYGFEDQYQVENHQGWMKWTHGSYAEYKQAKQYRNELINRCPQLPGPFVTAYQDGNRITVQEGLMITQQAWVQ
jgi:hypothetical protein